MAGNNLEKNRIDEKTQINHPKNCSRECPYGHDRAFCFPCYKKMMEELNARRKGWHGI